MVIEKVNLQLVVLLIYMDRHMCNLYAIFFKSIFFLFALQIAFFYFIS